MRFIWGLPPCSLYPLVNAEELPKALLPVGNKPMIYYQLQWLEAARIHEIIILTQVGAAKKIKDYFKIYESSSDTAIEVVTVDEDYGTADALRHIKNKIKKNFIVLSCDVITDVHPHQIIDLHRAQNPSATVLFYDSSKLESGADKPKGKDEDTIEYVGIESSKSRLVLLTSPDDIEDELPIQISAAKKFPVVNVTTQLRNAHIYIFNRWVMDLIVQKKHISSLREELLPLLVKAQYSKRVLENEGIDKLMATGGDSFLRARALSTSGSAYLEDRGVICTAVTINDSFCGRANTVWSYSQINFQFTKSHGEDSKISSSAVVDPKTPVSADSLIGESTKIGERGSIKKCIIGSHCTIGKMVKLTGCIIMDHVVIEDGAKLDGTIVCNEARIMEKATLKDCEVGVKAVVEREATHKNEHLLRYEEMTD
ncbi:nucleotide-diphospho-sugar transferase [Polychytrium aggregatum]|uniref:nucleotide-diphospho-sugar transferase n=1 Tax=Polychytrium aggregatum TaxID=110093 RepID=UPI0022FDE61C|nr:nucleotide-diphospho-sugar transferase [Polychytrium aggregatum]KAI9208807.1 nucleotide-diphospho-sugar transferase [Polychytrium aggregatum]